MLFQKEHAIAILFLIFAFSIGFYLKKTDETKQKQLEAPVADKLLKKNKPIVKKIRVEIQGAVKNPGKYKLDKGSRLKDLIQEAGGFTSLAKNKKIKKNYYLKEGYTFYIPFTRYNKKAKVSKKQKRIFIKKRSKSKIEVEIRGAVKKPGVYEVVFGARLRDLIKKAGGYRINAKKREKNYLLKDGQSFYISYNPKLIK